jgi:outer membrane receptor for ferrienterochelin and colicins
MKLKTIITGFLCILTISTNFAQTAYYFKKVALKEDLERLGIPEKYQSDANVFGHVVDKKTGEHIPFAHIYLKNTKKGTATDATGHYMLVNLKEGPHTLVAQAIGYKRMEKTFHAKKKVTLEINFELEPDLLNVEGIVVTANRDKISRKEATTVVNVLDSKTFDITQSVNLAEGLNFQPGLRVENNCQNCGFTQLRINGMEGAYTQILIDSRPVMSALSNVYGLDQIPATMVDRVEVIRGGGSSMYGSNAIAGTVNIITKEPVKNSYRFKATSGSYGNNAADQILSFNSSLVSKDYNSGMFLFGQYRNRDAYNANPDALWDANSDGTPKTKDDFSELGEIESGTFGMRTFYRFNLQEKINAEYHYIEEFRRGGNKFDRPAHMADIAEQIESKINSGSVNYEWLSSDYKHKIAPFTSLQLVDRATYYGAEQDPEAYGETSELTSVTGLQYSGYVSRLLFAPANLSAGVEYQYSTLEDNKIGLTDILTISDQTIRNLGGYLESEWNFDILKLRTGVRVDNHNLVNNIIFSPRANLLWKLSESMQLRTSYSTGFRAPQIFNEDLHIEVAGARAIRTINADNLTEERSQSFSLSLDHSRSVDENQTYILAEGFYTQLNDPFVSELIMDGDEAILFRTNGSGAAVAGMNLEGKWAYGDKLNLTMGYTLQQSKYDEKEIIWEPESGNPDSTTTTKNLVRTPKNYGYMVLNWNPSPQWEMVINGNYTGTMKVPHMINADNEYTVLKDSPEFIELGFKISREFSLSETMKLKAYTGVKNLLNSYQNDFDAGLYRDAGYIYGPGAPRMFYIGIQAGMW